VALPHGAGELLAAARRGCLAGVAALAGRSHVSGEAFPLAAEGGAEHLIVWAKCTKMSIYVYICMYICIYISISIYLSIYYIYIHGQVDR